MWGLPGPPPSDTLDMRTEESDTVELSYDLEIRGKLPRGTHEELRRRFGDFFLRDEGNRTVLSGINVDQAALRSLLGLLWDVGGEFISACCCPAQPKGQGRLSQIDH